MHRSTLGAADLTTVILGGIVVLVGLLSFVDPNGDRGAVVLLGILGGLLAAFVPLQPQLAPATKLPATRGLVLLLAGILAAGGLGLGALRRLSALFSTGVFSIIFDTGLIAAIALLFLGWQAYQREQGSASAPPPAA